MEKKENTASFETLLKTLKGPGVFELLDNQKKQNGQTLACSFNNLEKKVMQGGPK